MKSYTHGHGNVPAKFEQRNCPNSLGCLLASGLLVISPRTFPKPNLGVSWLDACSPKDFPSLVAAPEVSFPQPEGSSVCGLAKALGNDKTRVVIIVVAAISIVEAIGFILFRTCTGPNKIFLEQLKLFALGLVHFNKYRQPRLKEEHYG